MRNILQPALSWMGCDSWCIRAVRLCLSKLPTVAAIGIGVAMALTLPGSSLAGQQQAPNSRVVLDLPDSYGPSPRFAGFQDDATGVSFVIFEAPKTAFEDMKAGLTAQALAKKGIMDVTKGELKRSDNYAYYKGRQASPAGYYAKYMLLFQGPAQTVLISVNAPEAAIKGGAVNVADIESALSSAVTTENEAKRELFRFGYLGPFKETKAPSGTTKIFTLDGKLAAEQKDISRAVLIVGPSLDKRPILDAKVASRNLLATLAGYKDIKSDASRSVTIDGLKGIALEANARDKETNEPVRLTQVLLVGGGGGYYRMIGISPENDAQRLMPEFSKIMGSFSLVK